MGSNKNDQVQENETPFNEDTNSDLEDIFAGRDNQQDEAEEEKGSEEKKDEDDSEDDKKDDVASSKEKSGDEADKPSPSKNKETDNIDDKAAMSSNRVNNIVKGLQKGYSLNSQAISDINKNIVALTDAIKQGGNKSSDGEELLTINKMKEILALNNKANSNLKSDTDKIIDESINNLKIEGIIETKEDEDSLLAYALEIQEADLKKASVSWARIKEAERSNKKVEDKKEKEEKDKKEKEDKEEKGSKVGSPSGGSPSKKTSGVSYKDIRNQDFSDIARGGN